MKKEISMGKLMTANPNISLVDAFITCLESRKWNITHGKRKSKRNSQKCG